MQRSGRLTIPYDPDKATPLPRPFILEGEGKGRKPVSLKPFAPPPKPTFDVSPEIDPRDLYAIKWFQQFKSIEGAGSVTRSPETTTLSKAQAKFLNLKSGAGKYVRWVTGYKYNVISGKMDIPIYQYQRIDPALFRQWELGGTQKGIRQLGWDTDPKKAMALAKFLYKYGFRSAYFSLKKWIVQTALAIRDGQKRAYYDWYAMEKGAFDAHLKDWYKWRNLNF